MSAPDFSKLLSHPDSEEIIAKLTTGTSVKDITDWLKIKYGKEEQSHLRLPSTLLKQFLDSNLDLYSTMRMDLAKIKSGTIDRQISPALKNNKTYQERMIEIADEEVNINKTLSDLIKIIKIRSEQVFDKIQENPSNTKQDYALIKWLELLKSVTTDLDKIVNNRPDQVIQHNVTVQTIEQHTAIFQEAVRETLAEMDPDVAFLFIERMNVKMAALKPPEAEVVLSQEKRLKEAQLLGMAVNKLEDKDDK